MNKYFLRNYDVFLRFVRFVTLYEVDIQKLRYYFMRNVNYSARSTEIFCGKVFSFDSSVTQIHDTRINHSDLSYCRIKNGEISNTSFEHCTFTDVVFINIVFDDVVFRMSDKLDIYFVNCFFEKCHFENVIINNILFNKECIQVGKVNTTAIKLLTEEISFDASISADRMKDLSLLDPLIKITD